VSQRELRSEQATVTETIYVLSAITPASFLLLSFYMLAPNDISRVICGGCNQEFSMTVAQMETHGGPCPHCGATFDAADIKREYNRIRAEWMKTLREGTARITQALKP